MRNKFFRMAIVLAVTMTLSSIAPVVDSWAWSSGSGSSGGSAGSGSGGSGGGSGGTGGAGGGGSGSGAGGSSGAGAGGSGASGGGSGAAAGGGAGGGSGAGSASGGDSGAGGGSSVAVGTARPPGDAWVRENAPRGNFLASVGAFSFRQPAPAFRMTPAQERTWDTFRTCAPNGALIDELRVDGSFTFQATLQSDVRAIKTCMTRIGYRFDY